VIHPARSPSIVSVLPLGHRPPGPKPQASFSVKESKPDRATDPNACGEATPGCMDTTGRIVEAECDGPPGHLCRHWGKTSIPYWPLSKAIGAHCISMAIYDAHTFAFAVGGVVLSLIGRYHQHPGTILIELPTLEDVSTNPEPKNTH
jgi:hypothetical protein